MNGALLASFQFFASPIPELFVLVLLILLLVLRAWSGVTKAIVNSRVILMLTGSIFLFLFLFVVLMVVRFETVG